MSAIADIAKQKNAGHMTEAELVTWLQTLQVRDYYMQDIPGQGHRMLLFSVLLPLCLEA